MDLDLELNGTSDDPDSDAPAPHLRRECTRQAILHGIAQLLAHLKETDAFDEHGDLIEFRNDLLEEVNYETREKDYPRYYLAACHAHLEVLMEEIAELRADADHSTKDHLDRMGKKVLSLLDDLTLPESASD